MSTTTTLSELTGDYVLDTARTRIGFVARHTMAGRVRGRFAEFEGGAHLDGDDPSRSSVRLTVQAASIQTRNSQRDGHLRTRFLKADAHPALTFASTTVEQTGDAGFEVTGDLTICGVTRPVTMDIELTGVENGPRGALQVGFKGSLTINRSHWGVNWNAATTVVVSPKVLLEFDVTAIRRS
ncbi:YceI family protein [Microbispora sp. KK1-11]|uniref:YceI family protein n=1 Tax=Microbispora sp. KK1-11 TaxID=2053005 RepID=UPI00115B885A|nr:YceI family protein [Microbispora sp. KK1-11]TQS28462.1 YceI family protein [Microbispora sp. KK1-11]